MEEVRCEAALVRTVPEHSEGMKLPGSEKESSEQCASLIVLPPCGLAHPLRAARSDLPWESS